MMMPYRKHIDVVYLYEHVARELDVGCAFACILKNKYHLNVEIVQWPHGFHKISKYVMPNIVVLPFCYNSRSYASCLLEWRGATYFNASWEQLFYKGNRIAKAPRGKFALFHVLHHAWSNHHADILRRCGVPEQNILTNGQPAYTLYEEPYCNYFKQRQEMGRIYGLDTNKKWIFFPENYNWAFYSNDTLKRFIIDGQSSIDVELMKDYCQKSIVEVIKWCESAARYGNIEIIIRPRPATNQEEFRNYVDKTISNIPTGLHIIKSDSVREWIMASDIIVSSHSTSLIEASIAKKPAFILEPYSIPPPLSVEWHDYVDHIKSKEEFVNICCCKNQPEINQSLGRWARSIMMANGDSIYNMSKYIADLYRGDILPPPKTDKNSSIEHYKWAVPKVIFYELFKWGNRTRNIIFSRDTDSIMRDDIVSQAEINRRISKWENILFKNNLHVMSNL